MDVALSGWSILFFIKVEGTLRSTKVQNIKIMKMSVGKLHPENLLCCGYSTYILKENNVFVLEKKIIKNFNTDINGHRMTDFLKLVKRVAFSSQKWNVYCMFEFTQCTTKSFFNTDR